MTRELERGPEVTVVLRCIPLMSDAAVTGAVVLLRDISELRRRDRLLLSKDATIREIHHRVKNNLQTISSLLRLQGRRLASPEAKAAIEESVRRVRSIALVHEILSREAGEDVPFLAIVHDLTRMAEEAFADPDRPVRCKVDGEPGPVPATVATPLAVVLNELLQNAADHAFPAGGGGGTVVIAMRRDGPELVVEVHDDGEGLPEGFDMEASGGLGLSIVRTLVTSELAGTIERAAGRRRPGHGRPHRGPDRDPPGVTAQNEESGQVLPVSGSSCPQSGWVGRRGSCERWGQLAWRWRAIHARRILRRSSSEVPPQTPESWFVTRANSRQGAWTSHWPHTALAWAICSMAGPVVPTGKKRSGLVSRQAERSRQSSFSTTL